MKTFLIFILFVFSHGLYAQQTIPAKETTADTSKTISFISRFDETKMACKDGYAINGYIVNISYEQAKKLDGKTIKITGQYTIVKGLENQSREYDKDNDEGAVQGRLHDVRRIESPVIEVVN